MPRSGEKGRWGADFAGGVCVRWQPLFPVREDDVSCFGVAPVAQPMTFPIVGIASGSGAGAGYSGSCPPLCRARETKSVQSLEKRFVDLGSLSCLFAQDATPARLTPLEGTLSLPVVRDGGFGVSDGEVGSGWVTSTPDGSDGGWATGWMLQAAAASPA